MKVEFDVRLAPDHRRSDSEIAQAAKTASKWHAWIREDRVRLKVDSGWVTLGGELDWDYQRRAVERAVRALAGVVGVHNLITLKPQVLCRDVDDRIRDALTRHAQCVAKQIEVIVEGSTVTLRGAVESWAERIAAQDAASAAPGVEQVVNRILVGES